jgi:hypothetical protein
MAGQNAAAVALASPARPDADLLEALAAAMADFKSAKALMGESVRAPALGFPSTEAMAAASDAMYRMNEIKEAIARLAGAEFADGAQKAINQEGSTRGAGLR